MVSCIINDFLLINQYPLFLSYANIVICLIVRKFISIYLDVNFKLL